MATDKATNSVAVESAIHEVMAKAIQQIYEQHHIRVEHVSVQWVDVSQINARRALVRRIHIVSESDHP